VYIYIQSVTVYAFIFLLEAFSKHSEVVKTVHLPERDKTVFKSFHSAISGTEAEKKRRVDTMGETDK
jgi:hypothetical protein